MCLWAVWPCLLSSYLMTEMHSLSKSSLLKIEITPLPLPVLGCSVLQPQPLHWPLWDLLQYTGVFHMWESSRLGKALKFVSRLLTSREGSLPGPSGSTLAHVARNAVGTSLQPRGTAALQPPWCSWGLLCCSSLTPASSAAEFHLPQGPFLLFLVNPSLSCCRASSVPVARLCFHF